MPTTKIGYHALDFIIFLDLSIELRLSICTFPDWPSDDTQYGYTIYQGLPTSTVENNLNLSGLPTMPMEIG